jgi:DNA-binding LacI/PurR family transcriptional regulator
MNTQKIKQAPGRPEKYKQLRDTIITDILNSELKPGEFYATEQKLCDRFGVGRNTVRKALAEIEQAGFIVRRKRVGLLAGARMAHLNGRNYAAANASMPSKVILLLPSWDSTAGGFYSSRVLQELRSSEKGKSWIVDTRLHNDSLDHIGPDTEAVIAVDPSFTMCIQLQMFSRKGIRIIVIEPSVPQLDFAINICPAIYDAAKAVVKELHELGHERIGIINSMLKHDIFRQWLRGYLNAHHELQLPIHPNAVVQIEPNDLPQIAVDVKNISAWICTFQVAVDIFAKACNRNHLNIPEDISVIGSDDPGDIIVPSLGASLSIVRPDYSKVVRIIRQILQNQTAFAPGDIIELPTVNISRGSVASGQ